LQRDLLLKTPLGLLIGLFNNLPIVTTINYYTVAGLHTLQTLHNNLFTLPSVVFTYSQRGSYPSPIESHTPNITVLQYSHRILKTHNKSLLFLAFQLLCTIVDYHIKSSNLVFGSSFRVRDSLTTTALGVCYILTVTTAHTLSYKPLVGQWTTCLVSLLRCHLVYRLPSSSRYTARLLPDVFTGVVR
jgi:hypothetical protein